MGEIGRLICRIGIPKRRKISQIRFQKVHLVCDALATLFKNLVNLGSVTPEFKKGNDVHPVVYQRFGYEAPLLDLAVISSEFTVAITIQFCFTYTLEDATATR